MRLRDSSLDQIIKKPITITPNTPLLEVRHILLRHKIKRVIVSDSKNKPVGIITEKDIAKTIYDLGNRSIKSVKAKTFMSKNLVTVTKEHSVHNCATLMRNRKISSVIVVDDKGLLVGLITKTDLASVFLTKATSPLKVSEIMTCDVITVNPSDSLLYVQSLMFKYKISRIIVARNKRPVGIVTYRDFVPSTLPLWLKDSADPKEVENYQTSSDIVEERKNQLSYLLPFNAVDIMSSNPLTISAEDDVSLAVLFMIRHNISGLPVVKKSRLVGIVTKTDIVNAIIDE